MTASPFQLMYARSALKALKDLEKMNAGKYKKVQRALKRLRDVGPLYPSLQSHKYQSISGVNNEDVWESYAENRTPGAWRIWWTYGPEPDDITIVAVSKHP